MQTQGLALSLALSYTLSHHNCVRMLHRKHCLHTYKHGYASTPPTPLPPVEIKRGIRPGAWSWQFWKAWLGPPWFGYNTLLYCNYWESSFLLPLWRAPVPDGRKARALFPCAAVCLHFLLGKAQVFLGAACRAHSGLCVLLPYTVQPRHSLEDSRLRSVGIWARHSPK